MTALWKIGFGFVHIVLKSLWCLMVGEALGKFFRARATRDHRKKHCCILCWGEATDFSHNGGRFICFCMLISSVLSGNGSSQKLACPLCGQALDIEICLLIESQSWHGLFCVFLRGRVIPDSMAQAQTQTMCLNFWL